MILRASFGTQCNSQRMAIASLDHGLGGNGTGLIGALGNACLLLSDIVQAVNGDTKC